MNEFAKNGEYIVLNVQYAEAYIPFDIVGDPDKGRPTAYEYGEGFRLTGLFNIRFYNSSEITQEERESVKLRTFNYPNEITMFPSDKEIMTLKLDPSMDEDKYYVLKFYLGDVIMSSRIQQKSQNCEAFMARLIQGKLPRGLSYQDLYFSWQKNFKINDVDPGVPAITLQTIISENCRSKQDPMYQFRKVVNNPGVNSTDYRVHNMVDICSNSSVLNALTFERFSDMLTSSLNMSRSGVQQNTTPLEKILTM